MQSHFKQRIILRCHLTFPRNQDRNQKGHRHNHTSSGNEKIGWQEHDKTSTACMGKCNLRNPKHPSQTHEEQHPVDF